MHSSFPSRCLVCCREVGLCFVRMSHSSVCAPVQLRVQVKTLRLLFGMRRPLGTSPSGYALDTPRKFLHSSSRIRTQSFSPRMSQCVFCCSAHVMCCYCELMACCWRVRVSSLLGTYPVDSYHLQCLRMPTTSELELLSLAAGNAVLTSRLVSSS